mmetsp:Transcript_30680/g.89235  ORF Transcript_30680/g.89235 Transcript_30680/m.89235 type:complete len:93 (-) Transcript_30680:1610-1888(-)
MACDGRTALIDFLNVFILICRVVSPITRTFLLSTRRQGVSMVSVRCRHPPAFAVPRLWGQRSEEPNETEQRRTTPPQSMETHVVVVENQQSL